MPLVHAPSQPAQLLRHAAGALTAAALLLAAAPAPAQSLGAKIGTVGLGAEFGYGLMPILGVRANVHGGSLSRDFNESGIRYDTEIKFSSSMLMADLHPFAGTFRITGGVMFNDNKLDFVARGDGGTIEINGVQYPTTALGSVDGRVRFEKASPYLGIGWGSSPKGSGLFFSADIGAVFTSPTASLTGNCAPTLPAAACTQLQSDLRAEEAQFKDSVEDFKVWPLIMFGVGYRF